MVFEEFRFPEEKKVRVIVNTDAKNEVDDQFAIVQAVLSESFDLRGIVAAHFGNEKSKQSMQDSYDEIHAELWTRVRPHGAIGKYLAENVVDFNNEWTSRPREFRILGDSLAVGLILYNDCGEWEWKPAPEVL